MSIRTLFGLRGAQPVTADRKEPVGAEPPQSIPTPSAGPSVDPGIPAAPVEDMLIAQADLLSRIKLCYGADREAFEQDLLTPIKRFAAYVNLLPATADNYFSETGGLFRLGLEVGFYALQGTDGHIVSGRATITTRRQLEPRWRLATFFAGLCCEIHRTLSQLVVTDESGEEWPSYLMGLGTWLDQRRSRRFFIRWLQNVPETRALGLFALPHVVDARSMQHLAAGNHLVVPQLLASVGGIPVYRDQNVLVDLVKRASALVIDRNLIANANRYGRPILGAHIERYLIDAMRRLIVSHSAWLPNQERSRVWHAKDGLFIIWPNAVNEIRKLLEDDELPGIPRSPQTILEILLGAGVAVPHREGEPLWTIAPPPGKTAIEAMKLASPAILLPEYSDHRPLEEAVAAPQTPKQAPRATDGASSLAPPPAAGPSPSAVPRSESTPAGASAQAPSQQELQLDGGGHDALPRSPQGPDTVVTADGEVLPSTAGIAHGQDAAATAAPVVPATAQTADAPAPEPEFRLSAPMRLNPQVREALARAIESMNGDARQTLAVTVPAGVFVPFDHFKQAAIDIPVALRSLEEVAMTITGKAGRTQSVQHDMGGKDVLGFILKPQFVQGLDPALFTIAS